MTRGPKPVRFDAAVINRAAAVVEAPLLAWEVGEVGKGGSTFQVNLAQFAEGTHPGSPPLVSHAKAPRRTYKPVRKGYSALAGHPDLIRALAPTIRAWSATGRRRSVDEALSSLKHLFNFLTAAETAGVGPAARVAGRWTLADMSPELFQQFAEYLRRLDLSSTRMSGVYNTARIFVERAVGHEFLPSSPFSTLPDGEGCPQYSYRQMKALLDVAKAKIRDFKRARRTLLRGERAGAIRGFIVDGLAAGALRFNRAPESIPAYVAHEVFPGLRVASAFVLLALLRSGANLQPILSVAPGDWSQPNPFSPKYRTVVMAKHRRGRVTGTKIVNIPTQKRPEFYLYRALRYYELLVGPLRRAMAARRHELAEAAGQRERYVATLHDRFWLFLNGNLEVTALSEGPAIRGVNMLIAEACVRDPAAHGCLLDAGGRPIRFSSKAIRDGWFEFVLRNSRYNLMAGQIALSHSEDSPSIRHYIRHRWVRQFAEREMRRFHSAAVTVLDEKRVKFGPRTIRVTLDGGDILALAREDKARYGAYCRDPLHPPPEIYRPRRDGEICPAVGCDDCPYANFFTASLPDLIAGIEALQRRGDEMPAYQWEGSPDWERLGRLEDLLGRFPEAAVTAAREEAKTIRVPDLRFRLEATS